MKIFYPRPKNSSVVKTDMDMRNFRIVNIGSPSSAGDAVSSIYVQVLHTYMKVLCGACQLCVAMSNDVLCSTSRGAGRLCGCVAMSNVLCPNHQVCRSG